MFQSYGRLGKRVKGSVSRVSGEGGEVRRRAPNGSSKSYAKDMEPTVLASIERAVIDCL